MSEDSKEPQDEAVTDEAVTAEAATDEAAPTEAEGTETEDAGEDADPADDDEGEDEGNEASSEDAVPTAQSQFDHSRPLAEPKHYFDYPENVDKVLRWFFIGCGVLLVADVFVKFFHVPFHHHSAFPEEATFKEGAFETWPFFYAFYGFAACVLLVLAATQLRKVLMRKESYYDAR